MHRESDTLIVLGERESRLQGEGAYMARNMQRNKVPGERRWSPWKEPTSPRNVRWDADDANLTAWNSTGGATLQEKTVSQSV